MSKIMHITGTGSSNQDFDHKRKPKKYPMYENSPAVINHITPARERNDMKQLTLPFDDTEIEAKIFELYMYSNPLGLRYRTYGKHIDYTLAKSMNDAEELFSKSYPNWWATMGVREVDVITVKNNLDKLEQQVETCKFVLEAFSIVP